MLGMVFTVVADLVIDQLGHDVWDLVLDEAGSNGAHTMLGTYDDDELRRIVDGVARQSAVSNAEVMRAVGSRLMAHLMHTHGPLLPKGGLVDLLVVMNGEVHAKTLARYPSAQLPLLTMISQEGHQAVMRYQSGRRLCHLAEGMLKGAGAHFGLDVQVEQSSCALVDSVHCDLALQW